MHAVVMSDLFILKDCM